MPKHLTLSLGLLALLIHADATWAAAADAAPTATAVQALEAQLKKTPQDPDALGKLGSARLAQQRWTDAEQLLTQAVQKGGKTWQPALDEARYHHLLERAHAAENKRELDQARDLSVEAIRLKPEAVEAQLFLAGIQSQKRQWELAEATYRQVLMREPANVDAYYGRIAALNELGRTEEALQLTKNLQPSAKNPVKGLDRLRAGQAMQEAEAAEARGDLQGASRLLEQARKESPEDPWLRLAQARLEVRQGRPRAARDLVDSLVKDGAQRPEVLYASALLSNELGEYQRAMQTLMRIPQAQRSPDMNALAARITFNEQLAETVALAKQGRREEARSLMQRLETRAGRNPDLIGDLAEAFATAGDPEHGLALLKPMITGDTRPAPAMQLHYASIQLQLNQDQTVGNVLRDLQGVVLDSGEKQQYDDLLARYRIRQADRLTDQGKLAAAYDTLAPALKARPDDKAAQAALARMYLASGDTQKARQLYRDVLSDQPKDAELYLGAAEIAAKSQDSVTARQYLDQAVKLGQSDPLVLRRAALLYRDIGMAGTATDLLEQVVQVERKDRESAARAAGASDNPFATLPGQTRSDDALAAVPAAAGGNAGGADYAWSDPLQAQKAANNPFNDLSVVPTSSLSSSLATEQILGQLQRERSIRITQGLSVRSYDPSGSSRQTTVSAPLEISFPAGDQRLAVRVTPTRINDSSSDGSQKENGVAASIAVEDAGRGLKGDIGVSPVGLRYSTVVGGATLERPLSSLSENLLYALSVSRRSVTDSLASYGGIRDPRTGQEWGGVTANGGLARLRYDDGRYGSYIYGAAHRLTGHDVKDNDRFEIGTGVFYYLRNGPDSLFTVGLSATAIGYDNNQNHLTYGHGGYFSPQRYFAIGVPLAWAQRGDLWAYQVQGMLGVQTIRQDAADRYPDDAALQAAAEAAGEGQYGSKSKTGVAYSLSANGEYRLNGQFALGGRLGMDNSQDERDVNGNLYLRYFFEEQEGRPQLSRPQPYRSRNEE